MFIFKFGVFVLPATLLLTICSHILNSTKVVEFSLFCLYVTSGGIASKIIHDRNKQIENLLSTVGNKNVVSLVNRISSFASLLLLMGFLLYLMLFLIKVDNYCLTALNIFICGTGTLYIWMQSIITNYVLTTHYNKKLLFLRKWLTFASCLLLLLMAVFSIVTVVLPTYGADNMTSISFSITGICTYIETAMFSVYLLSFVMDTEYFEDNLESNSLLDDARSYAATSSYSIGHSNSILIKDSITYTKVS